MRVGALARRLPARRRLARLFGVEVALVAVEALVGSEAGHPLAAVRAPCALVAAGRPLGAVDAPSIGRTKEFDQCLWDFLGGNKEREDSGVGHGHGHDQRYLATMYMSRRDLARMYMVTEIPS